VLANPKELGKSRHRRQPFFLVECPAQDFLAEVFSNAV